MPGKDWESSGKVSAPSPELRVPEGQKLFPHTEYVGEQGSQGTQQSLSHCRLFGAVSSWWFYMFVVVASQEKPGFFLAKILFMKNHAFH